MFGAATASRLFEMGTMVKLTGNDRPPHGAGAGADRTARDAPFKHRSTGRTEPIGDAGERGHRFTIRRVGEGGPFSLAFIRARQDTAAAV